MSASLTEPQAGPGRLLARSAGPLIIAAVLVMLIVPLSPTAISLAFALNISAGLVILGASIYIPQAAEFLSFPSILLATTLMRLALNVATARAILLNGYTGSDAAGTVIQAFGRFVVGGNFVVGIIIFAILITINFVVVTKGSSRVAEVSARFMLDSLPGRQMAIDADVNAGAMSPKDAERRRDLLRREADFFGAMDGASKFVRGDVIAAMVILLVNLVGGLLIGTLQHGLPLSVAAHTYTLLTVGDGVAAQIPSLAISVAAGLIVTRVATGEDISAQIIGQLSRYPEALFVAAALLGALGLVPGMAHMPFLLFSALLAFVGLRQRNRLRRAVASVDVAESERASTPSSQEQARTIDVASVQRTDALGLEIGFALVPLLDEQEDGRPTLLARLTAIRNRYSQQMGFVLPNVAIRDPDGLRPSEYRFTAQGGLLGKGEVRPGYIMAIETSHVVDHLEKGRRGTDPVFGHPALWISREDAEEAEALGYTVVDCAAVIATHLDTLLHRHGAELLGRHEVEELIGHLAGTAPKLVDELRNRYQTGTVRQVLQALISEGVTIKGFEGIAEAMVDAPEALAADIDSLVNYARQSISRQVIAGYVGDDLTLRVFALDPSLEGVVIQAIDTARQQGLDAVIEPSTKRLLTEAAENGRRIAHDQQIKPVLVVPAAYRKPVARCLRGVMSVLAMEEIPDSQAMTVVAAIAPAGQADNVTD